MKTIFKISVQNANALRDWLGEVLANTGNVIGSANSKQMCVHANYTHTYVLHILLELLLGIVSLKNVGPFAHLLFKMSFDLHREGCSMYSTYSIEPFTYICTSVSLTWSEWGHQLCTIFHHVRQQILLVFISMTCPIVCTVCITLGLFDESFDITSSHQKVVPSHGHYKEMDSVALCMCAYA